MQTRSRDLKPRLGKKPVTWGQLIPCSSDLPTIDFDCPKLSYKIGSSAATGVNDIVIPAGPKISLTHCIITWDGDMTPDSMVTIQDTSSCGTWINGDQVGGGNGTRFALLQDRSEIAFGAFKSKSTQFEIPRYIFHHTALPAHAILDRYFMGKVLGKGAFGTVKEAVNRQTGDHYAVKMIEYASFAAPGRPLTPNLLFEVKQSVQKEIHALQQAGKHPNICQLKEAFVTDEWVYLILELASCGDMFQYLAKQRAGHLSEKKVKIIVRQTLTAVAYLHELGIIHRDLKLENLLLYSESPFMIKIADFGLAKIVDNNTMAKTLYGTPVYQAPELRAELKKILRVGRPLKTPGYSKVVDSYSIGVITYTLVTGQMPVLLKKEPDDNEYLALPLRTMRVTRPCIKFITSMMEWKGEDRLTAAEALRHPWLAQDQSDFVEEKALDPVANIIPPERKLRLRRTDLHNQKISAQKKKKDPKPGCFRAPSVSSDEEVA